MRQLPVEINLEVEAAWGAHLGRDVHLSGAAPVAGGCISPALRLESAAGDVAFLKWGTAETPAGLFPAEARSLAALRAAGPVPVPDVVAVGENGAGWLLLEWLPPALPQRETWERLGRGLADMHRLRADRYGWPEDNFIGPLAQANTWSDAWPDFWRARRLEPQLRRAIDAGHFSSGERRRFDRLLSVLGERLAGTADDGASLLHGDLWSGNVHVTTGGAAALIDPSSYHGHREVDLAMSQLFGGFEAAFYRAYMEAWPLQPGYEPTRRAIYQLYYLLVHVNLFGGGYVRQTVGALAHAGV